MSSGAAVADALRALRDELRGGRSLRAAVIEAAALPASPFAPLRRQLAAGRPLGPLLRRAATDASSPIVAAALSVLAVQADAGGDPVPAVYALEERVRARVQADRQARALTASSRLSARAMILLTPGFLGLLVLLDPAGTLRSLSLPATRLAVGGGLVLQVLGSMWISRLVRVTDEGPSSMTGLPVLRVFAAFAGRKTTPDRSADVADAAELTALVLDAGLGPTRALAEAAGGLRGVVAGGLRDAIRSVQAGAPTVAALARHVAPLGPDAERFVAAFAASDRLGVPLAGSLRLLADDLRDAAEAQLNEDVRRASVRVLLPLGLLILPAFVLSCLVPLLVGGLGGIQL